jgi:sigma-B regulation protein RsbU (phosphoserine phosphatase)
VKQKYKHSLFDIFKLAIDRETEAFNYYQKASKKALDVEAESLFIQLAEEERKHRIFLLREMKRIEKLMAQGSFDDYVTAHDVHYGLPDILINKELVTIPGIDISSIFLPSELLGGDIIQTVVLEREREKPAIGIFLCDVMGHGINATHLKAFTKKLFGEFYDQWINGSKKINMNHTWQVMNNLNDALLEECQRSERFVTVFYGIIDLDMKFIEYSSAGQEPPILIRSNGEYTHLDYTQLLLGVEKDVEYIDCRIPVEDGDVLVFFSDGITETTNKDEEMFGRERLYRSIQKIERKSSFEILQSIFDELKVFLKENPVTDELVLAVMKIL